MHSFTSGSSIVTLTRHPSGGSGGNNPGGATLAFTDADGNVITSVVDGVLANTTSADGGVTIVTTDSLAGSHFLSAAGDTVTKIEIDDDNINQMELMNPTSSPSASTSKGIKKGNEL